MAQEGIAEELPGLLGCRSVCKAVSVMMAGTAERQGNHTVENTVQHA